MRLRIVGIVLGGVAIVAAGLVVQTLWLAGVFRRIEAHFSGSCRLVAGPVGPEDITIDPRTGLAYVSASDRRAAFAGRAVPGAIYAYDLTQEGARPQNLTPLADSSFQPHGISLWLGEGEDGALFVVNHPPRGGNGPGHTIEIFDVRGGALSRRATLADPLLVMPNDVVAIGAERFYVTNTHANPPGAMQTIETYLRLPGAKVVHYAGGRFRPAIEGLVFPNGINMSADGKTLYVASTTGRRVLVYERDPSTDELSAREEVFVGSGLDNIEVDAQGDLWIGAHPKLLAVEPHMADASRPSPSQVVRIFRRDGRFEVQEVYLDAGSEISASSVAARWKDRLLIGQIASEGFLDCVLR
jgi:arylesterase/paraoxonase